MIAPGGGGDVNPWLRHAHTDLRRSTGRIGERDRPSLRNLQGSAGGPVEVGGKRVTPVLKRYQGQAGQERTAERRRNARRRDRRCPASTVLPFCRPAAAPTAPR
jgi:hypothetical protein